MALPARGIAAELGEYVATLKIEDIPQSVRDLARARMLDNIACTYAGLDFEPSRVAGMMARRSIGECTVIGRGFTAALPEAVMTNGATAHATSQDDVMAGVAHPGSVTVPAVLNVGEQCGASGAEAIVALVLGYDLVWRILRGTGPLSSQAVRPGTVFTAFGACAAASRLMKLSSAQTSHALGYAASLTPGCPNEGWWGGTMEPMLEIGMTARIGVTGAIFAEAGATCAPQVFEGRHGFFRCWSGNTDHAEDTLKDLGTSFAIEKTFMKPFAACGGNQVPMQVASALAEKGLRARDIKSIVEKLRPGGTEYAGMDFNGPFTSPVQALMSMQFCAAATILGRPVDNPAFLEKHYADPEVAALAARVQLVTEEGRSVPRFEVYLNDGSVLVAEEKAPDRSIHISTLPKMQEKLLRLAGPRIGDATAREVAALVGELESVRNVGRLTGLLRG